MKKANPTTKTTITKPTKTEAFALTAEDKALAASFKKQQREITLAGRKRNGRKKVLVRTNTRSFPILQPIAAEWK